MKPPASADAGPRHLQEGRGADCAGASSETRKCNTDCCKTKLKVHVGQAKHIDKHDCWMCGKNDPYVVISVSGETRRSSTIDGGGQNPIWGRDGGGEQINFEVSSAKAVELACYDEVRFCPSVRAINFSPTKLKSDLHACRIKTRTI